ncbi:hypothetical protein, partial [Streptomyces sp. NPDC005970]
RCRSLGIAADHVEVLYHTELDLGGSLADSGATAAPRRRIERMLWSDPPDEPPDELRRAQDMLRRASTVLAVATLTLMLLLSMHP